LGDTRRSSPDFTIVFCLRCLLPLVRHFAPVLLLLKDPRSSDIATQIKKVLKKNRGEMGLKSQRVGEEV